MLSLTQILIHFLFISFLFFSSLLYIYFFIIFSFYHKIKRVKNWVMTPCILDFRQVFFFIKSVNLRIYLFSIVLRFLILISVCMFFKRVFGFTLYYLTGHFISFILTSFIVHFLTHHFGLEQ